MGKKKRQAYSSESEDDPEVVLTKVSKKTLNKNLEQKPSRENVDRPSPPRVNAILVKNPLQDHELILFGGEYFDGNQNEFFDDTFLFDIKTYTWTKLNLLTRPLPRSAHQAVTLTSGQMMIFGGEFGSSKETKFLHFSDTWLFDFVSYAWRAVDLKEHPSSRSGHRMTRWGKHVFLFGGFFDTGKQARYLDDLWIFDTTELTWQKVDWMNEFESRPSARSGFTFAPHPEGILLYGGYAQVKNKHGVLGGQVMNDLWLLKIDPLDLKSLRWKRLKLGPNAPLPRSGVSSLVMGRKLYSFGGVIDEEISHEHLVGTCINDVYSYDFDDGTWTRIDFAPISESFCGRFNSMLTALTNQIFLFGGIFEAGDRQFTLDDIYLLDLEKFALKQIQPMSPDLEGCWIIKSHDDPTNSSTSDESSSDSGHSSSEDEDTDESSGKPVANHYDSLKAYFDDNLQYWMDLAKERNASEEITDKKLRSTAFAIAKQSWDDSKILELDLALE